MADLKILYHGEIQVLGWGESRNQGKYLKIKLWDGDGEDPLIPFRGLDDKRFTKSQHVLNCTIAQGDIIEMTEPEPENKYGHIATSLYRAGFFLAPPVLEKIGTDKQFREWIQKQPSAISAEFSEYVNGEGRCEAAHVRRSSEAGTGYKPPYACIPLTHGEHALQHQQGETALKPREWFEKARNQYVTEWAKLTLLNKLGDYQGFREVPPDILYQWCVDNNLTVYLPSIYRDGQTAIRSQG